MLRIFILHLVLLYFSCAPSPYVTIEPKLASKWMEGSPKVYKPSYQSNPNLDFYDFIKGVNTIDIFFSDRKPFEEQHNDVKNVAQALKGYLFDIGFQYVSISSNKNVFGTKTPYLCQKAAFTFEWKGELVYNELILTNIAYTFFDCKGNFFNFKSPERIVLNTATYNNAPNEIVSNMKKMFFHNIQRDASYTLRLDSDLTEWKEENLKEHFDNNGTVGLEGIYEKLKLSNDKMTKYKIGLKNNKNNIDVIYLGGAVNYKDWIEGERKATITKTATPNFYTVEWLMNDKYKNTDVYAYQEMESGLLTFEFQNENLGNATKSRYLKLYPVVEGYEAPSFSSPSNTSAVFRSSGSGFAISKDGIIVTNHHVIDNARIVKVQITQVGKNKTYDAEVVLSDPKNDLAILKIKDETFTALDRIPFSIKRKISDMGTSVYALGYPLIDTMGESIKLTDGIISSKMGYQGDITQYQLSVPVQPGNSGGPLFDKEGNLVGVINAKHLGADNATYAIKSNILANLIELLPEPPNLDNKNTLSELSLAKQVAVIEDFVFLIKVSKTIGR